LSASGWVKPQYKLLIPPNTDILVKISFDGYKTWYYPGTVDLVAAAPVRLGPGEKKTIDIRLEPDAEVKTGCPTAAAPDKHGKSERLVLDPSDHPSPDSVAQIPLRSREELFEQFF
jgi:hypothetical protein